MVHTHLPGLIVSCLLFLIGASPAAAIGARVPADVLDGSRPLHPRYLADVAVERAWLGARWLAMIVQPAGAYHYIYDPDTNRYIDLEYNEVRHAGTTYALYQVYDIARDPLLLAAAERATDWIERHAVPAGPGRRTFVDPSGTLTKLGGQALALVALLERRRVTGKTDADPLIADLSRFLVSMEVPDKPGQFFMAYTVADRRYHMVPASEYYPGETLLALTRLAQHFPGGSYLDVARRAAHYLVYQRDGNLPAQGFAPRDDHWLTIALSDLYRLDPNEDYWRVVGMQADRMIASQYTAADGYPARIGAAKRETGINYTSTATKGEALVAAWALAQVRGDVLATERYAAAAMRTAQFQMRVQYLPASAALFARPDRLIGGWPGSASDHTIRIDYVQHNISALAGVWCLVKTGDLCIAGTRR